jgi:hypothetical protein
MRRLLLPTGVRSLPALPPPVPAFQVSVYSSGTSKGIAQSKGPQVIGRGELGFGDIYVAGYLKNVTSPSSDAEAGGIIGIRKKLSGFNLSASATLRQSVNPTSGSDATALELAGSISRPIGPVTPSVSIIYSPDDLGSTRRSVFLEGGLSYSLNKQLSASVALGRRDRVIGADYTSWNAGLTWAPAKRVSFDARYYDTNGGSQWPYKARFVVGGTIKF